MKRYLTRFVLTILFLFTFIFLFSAKPPKYIFLFIGDGMGFNHVSLTEAYLSETIGFQHLIFTDFPVLGQCETHCKNNLITDSGAAGSAIACGEKADFETISHYENLPETSESIAKVLHKKDFKIGIITTTNMNDATPAAFYANNESRKNYYEIALQAPESDFEFFGGGSFYYPNGKNNDKKNILEIFKENNYNHYCNLQLINSQNDKKVIFTNIDILSGGEMPYSIDKNYNRTALNEIVASAIKFLDNEKGFFIMTEGGKIDWAAHENDAATVVNEVIDFGKAVQTAYEFYLKHPDETLIIVTADHETGGLSLGVAEKKYKSDFSVLNIQKCSYEYLTQKIENYKENSINYTIEEVKKLAEEQLYNEKNEFSEDENSQIEKAFDVYFKDANLQKNEQYKLYCNYNPLAITFIRIINNRAAVGFTTWVHTAAKVPVWVVGNGANSFSGTFNNSEIKHKILNLMKLNSK